MIARNRFYFKKGGSEIVLMEKCENVEQHVRAWLILGFNYNDHILSDGGSVAGDPWPEVSTLLGDWSCDGRALHLSLVVDYHSSIILEVDKLSVFSSEGLPLTDHNSRHDFFPQLGFTLQHYNLKYHL